MTYKNLSIIDETKFITECQDSLTAFDYRYLKGLPKITGIEYFDYFEGKYYCNKTFNNYFKTYIFCINEGGDSGPSLTLIDIQEDTLLANKSIVG
ncbi:MAG: hypothetical protein R2759_17380 [Bacteroidales bacterium]